MIEFSYDFDNNFNCERVPVSATEMASVLLNEKHEAHLMPPFYYRIAMSNKANLLNGEKIFD